MAIKVLTESTCDICGKIHIRDKAEGGIPPIDWASLELTVRLEGEGWTNHRTIYSYQVCAECIELLIAFVASKQQ